MIRERGGSWQVDVMVGRRRVRRQVPTYDEAVKLEAMLENKGAIATITMKHLLDMTWRRHWVNNKDGKGSMRRSVLVLEELGWMDREPASFTTADFTYLIDFYRDAGNTDATINRKLVAVTRLLSTAIDEGLINHRPVVRQLRERNGRTRFLARTEEADIASALAEHEYTHAGHLFVFLLDTGCRVSEALNLRPCDVNEEYRTVTFNDTKNGDSRTVPLTPRAFNAVFKWRELSYKSFYDQFVRARSAAGLDDKICIHTLRHTCASRLVQNGVDLRVVKDWMGHKSITVTMRYAHLKVENLMDARDALVRFHAPKPCDNVTVTSCVTP